MSARNDPSYYAVRAEQERRMAEEAANPKIAALHRELANRYEELAGTEKRPKTLGVRTG